jgi:membrane protein implicated in regulation of membrane protease activity
MQFRYSPTCVFHILALIITATNCGTIHYFFSHVVASATAVSLFWLATPADPYLRLLLHIDKVIRVLTPR